MNNFALSRIRNIIQSNISQSKLMAIELKKNTDQKAVLRNKINKTRRDMNFVVDEMLIMPDLTGLTLDYVKLEESSRLLSNRLSSSITVAVSYLCELIRDYVSNDKNLILFNSDITQISILISNTAPLGVDFSAASVALSQTHVMLENSDKHSNYQSMINRLLDIIRQL